VSPRAKESPCKSVTSCKRVAVQKCHLVQKRPFVQKCPRAKVSLRAKVTLVQKCRSCKSDPFPFITPETFFLIFICNLRISSVSFKKLCPHAPPLTPLLLVAPLVSVMAPKGPLGPLWETFIQALVIQIFY